MNVLPAIIRELRSEARNPHNHWTRLLVGLVAGVILFGVFFSHLGRMGVPPDGSQLFPILHRTVFPWNRWSFTC
jgi:hypothetical protein